MARPTLTSKNQQREEIAATVAAHIERGGAIREIPTGVTTMPSPDDIEKHRAADGTLLSTCNSWIFAK